MECENLLVPGTHDGESTQRGSVPMYRLASTGHAPLGTLVVSIGAVGLRVEYLLDEPDGFVSEQLREMYDLVFVVPRAAASPWWLSCNDKLLDQVALADPTPTSADQAERQRQALVAVAKNCIQPNAVGLSPRQSAGDLDIVRSVLGLKKLKLYATSYSSVVAMEYVSRYPGNLAALVMDGAHDVRRAEPQTTAAYAQAMEVSNRIFIRNCMKDSACPLGQDPVVAGRRLAAFLDGLDRQPLDTGNREIPKFGEGPVREVLASWYDAKYLASALRQGMTSHRGNEFFELWTELTGRTAAGHYDDDSLLIGSVISSCLHYAPSAVGAADAAALASQLRSTYPLWGPAAAWSSMGGVPLLGFGVTAGCPGWSGPSVTSSPVAAPKGLGAKAPPVLVIDNGDSDEAPGVFSQAAISRLARPGVLKVRGEYLALIAQSDCVWDEILGYLDGTGLPAAGATCK